MVVPGLMVRQDTNERAPQLGGLQVSKTVDVISVRDRAVELSSDEVPIARRTERCGPPSSSLVMDIRRARGLSFRAEMES